MAGNTWFTSHTSYPAENNEVAHLHATHLLKNYTNAFPGRVITVTYTDHDGKERTLSNEPRTNPRKPD